MKISTETLNFLKHCSGIAGDIVINPGNRIISKSRCGQMVATAVVEEHFNTEFVTTDLAKFLSIASLFKDPDFTFNDDHVLISTDDGLQTTKFFYAAKELVEDKQPNKLPKEQPDIVMTFSVSNDSLQTIFKAISAMGVGDIVMKAKDGVVTLTATDKKISSSNFFDVVVGACDDATLEKEFVFKKSSLTLFPGLSYKVRISERGLAEFKAIDSGYEDLVFYVVAVK